MLVMALTAALSAGGALSVRAMPSDVGGTWNAEPVYAATPMNLYWDGTTARWGATSNAVKYELQLIRGQQTMSVDTTTKTAISYRTLMEQQSGEYMFRVRAYSTDGYVSEWSPYSQGHHISGYDPGKNNNATYVVSEGPGANPYYAPTVKYGWMRSNDGYFWMWRDSQGDYVTEQFRQIDGNTYYFDANGYMFTGWMSLEGATYYFFSNGIMATGRQQIDGRTYSFNDQMGPGYGALRQ